MENKDDQNRKTVDSEVTLLKDWEMIPTVFISKGQKITVSPERYEILLKDNYIKK